MKTSLSTVLLSDSPKQVSKFEPNVASTSDTKPQVPEQQPKRNSRNRKRKQTTSNSANSSSNELNISVVELKKISQDKQQHSEQSAPNRRRRRTHKSADSISSSSQSNAQSIANSAFIHDLNKLLNEQNDNQIFSTNALFHSSSSLLTKLDLKALFQPSIFESLPRQAQLKLIKLLPECDRQLDSHGSFK